VVGGAVGHLDEQAARPVDDAPRRPDVVHEYVDVTVVASQPIRQAAHLAGIEMVDCDGIPVPPNRVTSSAVSSISGLAGRDHRRHELG
jgi:hypothetical protein